MLLFEPGERYLAVSITGCACNLLCEYCRGRWLCGMTPATTPETLLKLVERKCKRLTGILVSGGFDRQGRLPYKPFIAALVEARRRCPHLIISMHTGFIGDRREARLLSHIVDYVDYEVPTSRGQLRLMHLAWRTIEDYIYDALMLKDEGVEVAPHFLLGLAPDPREEHETLELTLRVLRPSVTVLLYYTGARRDVHEALYRLAVGAKIARRYGEVSLGCMRPLWLRKREYLILSSFDRLAVPSIETRRALGKPLPYCCAVPRRLLLERAALLPD